MTVLLTKSICIDCIWKKSCQKLERINGIGDKRNNPGYTNEVFEVIIHTCSTKNYDRSYKAGKEDRYLYYCKECDMMHHSNSRIGIVHKKVMS